jgi:hypothetical protein
MSRRRALQELALLLLAALYLSLGLRDLPGLHDEGCIVTGASRILRGQVPYRDFWSPYAPGQYYVVAGLFRAFGESLLTERIWDVLVRSVLALLLYRTARTLTSPSRALVTWGLSLLSLDYFSFPSYPVFPALLSGMLCLGAVARSEGRKPLAMLAAGGALGATALLRHDLALYLAAAMLGVVILELLAGRRQGLAKGLAAFALGAAVVLLPVGIALVRTVSVEVLVDHLVRDPSRVVATRKLPLPSPLDFRVNALVYAPLLLLPAGALRIWREPSTGGAAAASRRRWTAALLGMFGAFSWLQSSWRADIIHCAPSFLAATPLLPTLLRRPRAAPRVLPALVGLVAIATLSIVSIETLHRRFNALTGRDVLPASAAHSIVRAKHIRLEEVQEAALEYVRGHVAEGAPIFVGSGRHDRVVANDAMFYFLAERECPHRFDLLEPHHVTTEPVQREILESLRRRNVRLVVQCWTFEQVAEPNRTSVSSGVKLLDEFLEEEYSPVAVFGPYRILARR